ncbi:hypothetical protein [Ectobacillus panaciterrae]|uniref:hypothetical protein n=1 Tax=Ectobacillus panaciterrae TaxID=363872 RepID=UPI0003FE8591|nr:hypothetical protein [Ectobacillus panaciterrae]
MQVKLLLHAADFFGISASFVMEEKNYLFRTKVLVEEQEQLDMVCIENAGHVCNIDWLYPAVA